MLCFNFGKGTKNLILLPSGRAGHIARSDTGTFKINKIYNLGDGIKGLGQGRRQKYRILPGMLKLY